jgi:hypothetical protein
MRELPRVDGNGRVADNTPDHLEGERMLPTPEDVQAMLRAEPFKPLQVRLTDGSIHVITHPRLSMVTRQRLIVGHPDPDDARIAGDLVYLAWSRIAGIDRLVPEQSQA